MAGMINYSKLMHYKNDNEWSYFRLTIDGRSMLEYTYENTLTIPLLGSYVNLNDFDRKAIDPDKTYVLELRENNGHSNTFTYCKQGETQWY